MSRYPGKQPLQDASHSVLFATDDLELEEIEAAKGRAHKRRLEAERKRLAALSASELRAESHRLLDLATSEKTVNIGPGLSDGQKAKAILEVILDEWEHRAQGRTAEVGR